MISTLQPMSAPNEGNPVDLGAFSISLTVRNLPASRRFYETLGFEAIDGDDESWIMLKNGDALVGLFHGMFEQNMITFNPPDARIIETALASAGFEIVATSEGETGPAHFIATDPDGNSILVDQH